MARPKPKLISERCYNQDQSWYFERTVKVKNEFNERSLRVTIRRNAYDNQSYARVDVWDTSKNVWNRVVNAPITECECKRISYVDNHISITVFGTDYSRLLDEALKICWD